MRKTISSSSSLPSSSSSPSSSWSRRCGAAAVALLASALVWCACLSSVAHAATLTLTAQTSSAPWRTRHHAALSTLNAAVPFQEPSGSRVFYAAVGSMILFGGDNSNAAYNDVWISQDAGTSWSLVSGVVSSSVTSALPTASFSARFFSAACEDPTSDRFYSLSGSSTPTGAPLIDAWNTTDGLRWSSRSISSPSSFARLQATCAVDSIGVVYLIGGRSASSATTALPLLYSRDHGASWTELVASSATTFVADHTSLIAYSRFLQAELVYTLGGLNSNSQPTNQVTAYQLPNGPLRTITSSAAWSARSGLSSVVTSAGVLLIFGGKSSSQSFNDIWATFDGGVSWSQCALTSSIAPRSFASVSLDVNEYLYIAGGVLSDGTTIANDVFRSAEPLSDARRLASICSGSLPTNGIGYAGSVSSIPSSLAWRTFNTGQSASTTPLRKNFLAFVPTSDFTYQSSLTSATVTVPSSARAIAIVGGEYVSNSAAATAVAISLDGGLTWDQPSLPDASFLRTNAMTCYDASSTTVYSIGGRRSSGAVNTVWVADSSLTWRQQTDSSLPSVYDGSCVVSRTGRIYLVNVRSSSGSLVNSVWLSDTSGARWSAAASANFVAAQGATPVAGYSPFWRKTVLWNIGGLRNGALSNAVWVSTDESSTWAELTAAAAWTPRMNAPVAVTSSYAMIIGPGVDANGNAVTQIASSFDGGRTWGITSASSTAPASPYTAFALDAVDTLYAVDGTLGVVFRSGSPVRDAAIVSATPSLTKPATVGLRCANTNPTSCTSVFPTAVAFTELTSAAVWPVRAQPTFELTINPLSFTAANGQTVNAPAGSFVLFGGRAGGTADQAARSNDVWVSTDIGLTWQFASGQYVDSSNTVHASAQPGASFVRRFESADCDDPYSDAAFSISGSISNAAVTDVWYSPQGLTWTKQATSTATLFAPRTYASCVVDKRGSVYLVGGLDESQLPLNDVWKSDDRGLTWSRSTAFAAWPARREHLVLDSDSAALDVQLVYVLGGAASGPNDATAYRAYLNDVWVSSDSAKSWQLVTGAAAWSGRHGFGGTVTSSGVIVVFGGVTLRSDNAQVLSSELWTSLDGGYTWSLCMAQADTNKPSPRLQPTLSLDAEEYLYIAAGSLSTSTSSSTSLLNDVFKSTFSLTDTSSLASKCSAASLPARGTGLRCFPGQVCVEKRALTLVTMSASAPWSERLQPAWQTVMKPFNYTSKAQGKMAHVPTGSLVLYGGTPSSNDVWVTTDRGQSWDVLAGADTSRVPIVDSSSPLTSFTARMGAAVCEDPSSDRAYSISGVRDNSLIREVWATDTSIVWTQMLSSTSAAAFVPRKFAGCVVDSTGTVFLTGGTNAANTAFLNDIWSSSDRGATWQQVTNAAAWPARHEGMDLAWSSPVFDRDVLWMMGGSGASDYNDVYVSTDGAVTYTLLTVAPWLPRWGGSAVISSTGVIAVFGGRTSGSKYLSDLWFSVDGGYTWGQSLDASRSVSARAEPALTLDLSGYLYIAAGIASDVNDRVPLTDVFRSSFSLDDVQRVIRSVDLATPIYGVGLRCVGEAACRTTRSLTLLKMTNSAPWSARIQPAFATTLSPVSYVKPFSTATTTAPKGSIVFYGGRYLQNDVWISSTQGESWDLVSGVARTLPGAVVERSNRPDSSFAARYTDATCDDASSGALYSISGAFAQSSSSSSSSSNAAQLARQVWRSADGGLTWSNVLSASSAFEARWWSACTVLSSGVVLLAGGSTDLSSDSGSRSDVWASGDSGATWSLVTPSSSWDRREEFMMVSQSRSVSGKVRDIVWVMGGARLASNTFFNDVHVSSDGGSSWVALTSQAAWSPRWGAQATITKAGVIVFFGGKTQTGYSSSLWVTFDGGAQWSRVTTSLPARVEASVALDASQYLYVVAGSDGETEYNDVYRSTLSLTDSRRFARLSGAPVPSAGIGLLEWPQPTPVNLGALAGMVVMVLFIGVFALLSYLYYRWSLTTYGSFRWPTSPVRADLWAELREWNYFPCASGVQNWFSRRSSGGGSSSSPSSSSSSSSRSNGLLGSRAHSDDDDAMLGYAPPSARL